MRLSTRTLGRAAATVALTGVLAGTGAASAFATPGHGGHGEHSWSWSYGQGDYSYSYGADGSWSWWWGEPQQTWTWTDDSWDAPVASTWTATAAAPASTPVTTYPSTLSTTASNGYWYGNCTWYAFERRVQLGLPVSGNWGNASSWAWAAAAQGFSVSGTPTVGAILVSTAGWMGHVAIVESVNGDGSVTISEMNYAGFNVVSQRTLSAGEAAGYSYIA